MRRRSASLAVLLALVMGALACASAPPDRVALSTLQTLKATTDAAMRTANDLYVAGQVSETQVRTLIRDYDLYAAANRVAGAGLLAIASQNTPVTQAQVDALMEPVRAASAKVTSGVSSGGH